MASDVRFLKQRQPGNPPARKLVPQRFPDRMQAHFLDEALEQRAQNLKIRHRRHVAMMSVDNPLTAGIGHSILPRSAWRRATRSVRLMVWGGAMPCLRVAPSRIQDRISPPERSASRS